VQKADKFQHAQGCEAAREGLAGRLGGNADRKWSQNPEARLFQTGALPSGRGRQAGAQRLGGRRDRREARVCAARGRPGRRSARAAAAEGVF
jgi:hypothetical protein